MKNYACICFLLSKRTWKKGALHKYANLYILQLYTFLKLIHFLSILYKWKTIQHLPLSKDWQTVYEHIELACGLWQPVPTLLHQLVNYRACGNSCESDLFYPGILLQKPSQHCQLPARKGRNSNSLKNIFPPSKILLRHYRDAISVTTIFKVLSYLI